MKTAIFKGYDEDGEVWAIGKTYGENDYETKFICPIEPTKEIVEEYERRKNVFDNNGKKSSDTLENWQEMTKSFFIYTK